MDYCHLSSDYKHSVKGTVLAPFLFALYTADCRSTDESCPVVKFADDTELVEKLVMVKMQYTTSRLKTL